MQELSFRIRKQHQKSMKRFIVFVSKLTINEYCSPHLNYTYNPKGNPTVSIPLFLQLSKGSLGMVQQGNVILKYNRFTQVGVKSFHPNCKRHDSSGGSKIGPDAFLIIEQHRCRYKLLLTVHPSRHKSV